MGRALFTAREGYTVLCRALRAIPGLGRAKRDGLLTDAFKERIMLAVTAVNGCAMCTYGHTRMALEAGMGEDEIRALLAGEQADVPGDELTGVLFAQHYADTRGKPTRDAWARVEEAYGPDRARAVLCAVCTIMAGNTYGIPLGSLKGRLGKGPKLPPDGRSSLGYELKMLFSAFLFLPVAAVHALLASLFRRPLVSF